MEVSTMSPSPASPTGEDPCEIDMTTVSIDGFMLLLCLCGVAGNGAVLCLLRRNSITLYILDLAFADFLFLLLMVSSTLLYLLENMFCSTIMPLPYLGILFLLSLLPYNTGMYLLTAISIDRCTFWYHCHRPQRLLEVVNVLLWAVSVGFIVTVTSLCLCQEHKHCHGARILMYSVNLFLFAPTLLISSTILFIKIKCDPQQQQLKKIDIVILLAGFFLLLFTLPLGICNFLQQLGYIVVPSQVVFLLACINSTIKPIIYLVVVGWWRHRSIGSLRKSLQRVFEESEENTACSDDATMDTAVSLC